MTFGAWRVFEMSNADRTVPASTMNAKISNAVPTATAQILGSLMAASIINA
jgi:hypothetical protein